MPSARAVVFVFALAFLVGCGGGDDDGGPAQAGGAGTTVTTADGSNPADEAEATRIGFHFYDFPAGWREAPAEDEDDAEEEEFDRKGEACVGVPDPAEDKETADVSVKFTQGQALEAESQVLLLPTEALARASADYATSDKFAECFKNLLVDAVREELPPGLTVADSSVAREDPTVAGVRAFRYVVAFTLQGPQSVSVRLDIVGLQRGRALAALSFTAVPGAFDRKLEDVLVGKVAERMRAAK